MQHGIPCFFCFAQSYRRRCPTESNCITESETGRELCTLFSRGHTPPKNNGSPKDLASLESSSSYSIGVVVLFHELGGDEVDDLTLVFFNKISQLQYPVAIPGPIQSKSSRLASPADRDGGLPSWKRLPLEYAGTQLAPITPGSSWDKIPGKSSDAQAWHSVRLWETSG